MNEPEIYEELTRILRELTQDPTVTLTATTGRAQVHGWDSIMQVNIIVSVEDRFDIRVESRELNGLKTIEDFVRLIRSRTGG